MVSHHFLCTSGEPYNEKSDIYSFGLLCYEVSSATAISRYSFNLLL